MMILNPFALSLSKGLIESRASIRPELVEGKSLRSAQQKASTSLSPNGGGQ